MRFFKTFFSLALLVVGLGVGAWQSIQGSTSSSPVILLILLGLLAAQTLILFARGGFRLSKVVTNSLRALNASNRNWKADSLVASDENSTTEWILEELAGGIITVSGDGTIVYLNKSAEILTGYSQSEVVSKPVNDVLQIEDSQGKAIVPRVMEVHKAHPQHLLQFGQVKLLPKRGEARYVELHTTHLHDPANTLVFIFRDVTADRKVINRLYQQASHDALTGLMNRRSFEECIEQVAHDETSVLKTHVLVSIDLDNFKIVNDTCGHQAGDELLKQVAHIFQRFVRQTDKVARMGGDEFAIFLENCALEKARTIMDSILVEMRNFRFSWEGKVFTVTGSIGLVEFVPSPELPLKNLFSDADRACYTAKALGRNQTFAHLNTEEVYHSEQRHTDWGKVLEKAIENDRFILFVQPIMPLQDSTSFPFHQYEVLLRLPFRKHLLSPGSFLPAADRLDMMCRIDRWIIRKVLEMVTQNNLRSKEGIEPRLMINLSSQAVQDPDLFAFIQEEISKHNVNPVLLCFEIAESVAIANFMQTKRLMKALHALGCHLVLDDFGSGFSSLNYVRDLPLSYLKIDGNFVHNLVSNPVDAAMIKAVHEVGQVMNLLTIAELVEDSETLERLRTIGVDFAQGYYCGKPFPFKHLCAPVNENEPAVKIA
ncbi:MAG: putative bifunctional diguanylate cyclase/phosphodiesterase [Thiolinea sp.]